MKRENLDKIVHGKLLPELCNLGFSPDELVESENFGDFDNGHGAGEIYLIVGGVGFYCSFTQHNLHVECEHGDYEFDIDSINGWDYKFVEF